MKIDAAPAALNMMPAQKSLLLRNSIFIDYSVRPRDSSESSVLVPKFVNESLDSRRHTRGSGHPEVFEVPGFRLALAIASLAGMTFELFNELKKHHTRYRAP